MEMIRLSACITLVVLLLACRSVWAATAKGALPAGDKTDVTAALQALLDAKAKDGGGVVALPAGQFRLDGSLSIPSGVTLQGEWQGPHFSFTNQGTCLLAYGGRGQEEGPPLIMLNTNSTLKGVTVFYPKQTASDIQPYPWTIAGKGTHMNIIDVTLVNPYRGIEFSHSHAMHYIRNVYGCPLRTGVRIDGCYDIGRIENVHFNPNSWTRLDAPTAPKGPEKDKLMTYLRENCVAFEIGRSDWEFLVNTFSFGCKVGYRFYRSQNGVANGNFLGIAADWAVIPLLVEESADFGLLITNGEFVGSDKAQAAVAIAATNQGVVQLSNCSFWGSAERVALVEGRGAVSFNQCNFSAWDTANHTSPAIDVRGGTITLQACRFALPQPDIRLGPEVVAATIIGNQMAGKIAIENAARGAVAINSNIAVNYDAVKKAEGGK